MIVLLESNVGGAGTSFSEKPGESGGSILTEGTTTGVGGDVTDKFPDLMFMTVV